MEIKYNELEKKEYDKLSKEMIKVIMLHLFLMIIMSTPLIVGILFLTISHKSVLGIFWIMIGTILALVATLSFVYAIWLYFKTKRFFKVFRMVVTDVKLPEDNENRSLYKISTKNKNNILFINTKDNVMITDGMEVDVIFDKKGKELFAIPQINIYSGNSII